MEQPYFRLRQIALVVRALDDLLVIEMLEGHVDCSLIPIRDGGSICRAVVPSGCDGANVVAFGPRFEPG